MKTTHTTAAIVEVDGDDVPPSLTVDEIAGYADATTGDGEFAFMEPEAHIEALRSAALAGDPASGAMVRILGHALSSHPGTTIVILRL